MYRFRRNVTVTAIETHNARDSFDGPSYRWTHLQRYSLDAAVNPRLYEGLGHVIHRMGIGRVVVRYYPRTSA